MNKMVVMNCDDYIKAGKEILIKENVPEDHAELTMASLLDSDQKRIYSHGLFRIGVYVRQLGAGNLNARPDIKKIIEHETTVVLDADNALGAVSSHYAMNEALKIAARHGVGVVGVRNGSHFGRAAYWAEMAAKENQIGFSFTNGSPAIAPTGSKKAVFGSNPWSISVPTNRGHPITLDISNGMVARGKIRLQASKGESIPLGWALNKEGQPTTDPYEALESKLILPIGNHKGYGIALMVDILAGVLTGAHFADQVGAIEEDRPKNSGHLFMALKIKNFMDIDKFKSRIDQLWETVKSAPKIDRDGEIYLPGEMGWTSKSSQAEGTVRIPHTDYLAFERLCREYGVGVPDCRVQD